MHMEDTDSGTGGGYERQFSDRLRFLRNKKRISAREMSIALGQNVNYVNLIENGKRTPSLRGFFAMCDYLETSPEVFFSGKTEIECDKDDAVPDAVHHELSAAVALLTEEQSRAVLRLIRAFTAAR